ncbi:MAG: VOC family protein [Chloroflexi bacterium]|nr:VOC family protein [Chloroflexota bacterium]
MIKGIGHIGIFVSDIAAAVESLCKTFDLETPAIQDVPERSMKIAVIPWGAAALELVEDYSDDGAVARMVKERGSFIHHFCLLSDNIEIDITNLQSNGAQMAQPEPVLGLRGKRTAFIQSGVLDNVPIELSEP